MYATQPGKRRFLLPPPLHVWPDWSGHWCDICENGAGTARTNSNLQILHTRRTTYSFMKTESVEALCDKSWEVSAIIIWAVPALETASGACVFQVLRCLWVLWRLFRLCDCLFKKTKQKKKKSAAAQCDVMALRAACCEHRAAWCWMWGPLSPSSPSLRRPWIFSWRSPSGGSRREISVTKLNHWNDTWGCRLLA